MKMKILTIVVAFGLIQQMGGISDSGDTSTGDPAPGRSPGPPINVASGSGYKDIGLYGGDNDVNKHDNAVDDVDVDDVDADADDDGNKYSDESISNDVKTTNSFVTAEISTPFANKNTINIDLNSKSNSNVNNKKFNSHNAELKLQRHIDDGLVATATTSPTTSTTSTSTPAATTTTTTSDDNRKSSHRSVRLTSCLHVNDGDDDGNDSKNNNNNHNKFNDYVKMSDSVMKMDRNNVDENLFSVDVNHDMFDTSTGLLPGIIYTVELTVATQKPTMSGTPTTIVSTTTTDGATTTSSHRRRQHSMPNSLEQFQDLFIETTNSATNEPYGHFIGYPFMARPVANVEPLWVRDTEWLPADHRRRPDWNHEDMRGPKGGGKKTMTKRQIWDTGGGEANNDQSSMSDGCVNNVWYQKSLHTEKIHLKWILDSDVNRVYAGRSNSNITIKFRVRLNDLRSSIVHEMSLLYPIEPDCKLFLKHPSGSLNSSFLTTHRKDCVVHFPSHDISPEPPPGLLVHLTRLNVPCTTGGYLAFRDHNPSNRNSSGQQRLCGKLEEFSPAERTFYYPSHNQTSVRIVGSPLFSLNYKLVDYCYNMTLSERRRTFLLRPRSSLECYFKIHLPFGNRIAFDMITNSDGDGSNNPTNNTREYIDLGAVAVAAAPTSSSTSPAAHKSDSKNIFQKCDGISIQVSNMARLSHWQGCVEAHSPMRFYSILSDTNILVIRVVKSVDNQMLAPSSRVPSLYMEYNAHPVESIVSQCAFGWISLSQFCVTAIEQAVDWPTAETECNKFGGHLVSVRSANDQKLIDQLLLNSPGYRDNSAYWIGATDQLYEGDFRWVDSLPFTFSNWFPGYPQHNNYNKQPNDDGLSGQDCVEIRRQFHVPPGLLPLVSSFFPTYMWNDRNCETQNYFVCERPIVDEPMEKQWENDCNKTILLTRDRPKTSVWSPGFPRQYPDNINCFTFITVPTGFRIVLEFEELVIENEPQCDYDYLEIFEPEQMDIEHRKSPFGHRTSRHSSNKIGMRKSMFPNGGYSQQEFDTVGTGEGYNLIFQPLGPGFSQAQPPPNFHKGEVPRKMCGDWSSKLKLLRHVTKGFTLGLHFVSDYSHHFGGFKARASMENVATECADERLKSYNGSCYLFVTYPEVDWLTAQQVCRGIDGQLASISTSDEQRFVTANIRNHVDYSPRSFYWLGGEVSPKFGFEWTDGSSLAFQGWLPGQEPNLRAIKNPTCLGLQWKTSPTPMLQSGLYWSVQNCGTFGGYVCKTKRRDSSHRLSQNQTLTGSEGRFVSPGFPNFYPSNMDYWIRIVGPERTRLIVQFQKITIEQQDECLYDYISLQDVDLFPYLSSIELEMDPNRMPMAVFGSHQQKNTHSFDEDYQNDEAATAEQLENRRRRAAIKNEFNGVLAAKRRSKRLAVKDDEKRKPVGNVNGNDLFNSQNDLDSGIDEPSFTPYVRWCGNHDSNMSRFDFISSTNEAILHFHSDHSITAMGFAATWNSVDVSGCPYQTLTSREGVVHSPNYPHFLLNNLDCTFTLQAPQDKKVWLEFQDHDLVKEALVELDLGSGGFRPFQTDNHINDGAFVSLGETLILRIRTGNEPRGRGFKAVYKTTFPIVEERIIALPNNTNGVLLHLNYPKSLPNNVEYTQHLVAPLGDVIIVELSGVSFTENGCPYGGSITITDNYADTNGTAWHLCHTTGSASYNEQTNQITANYRQQPDQQTYAQQTAPIFIISYLNTLHIRQKTGPGDSILNATIRTQFDTNYKQKLKVKDDNWVETCHPNPCLHDGKCITFNSKKICKCKGHFTGRFCGLTMCEVDQCSYGKCELTPSSFKCHCQPGYKGQICDQPQKPCSENPCEGRGECVEKNAGFVCRCYAWWEGARCEKRMMHIPYKPLSERMLQEPFWLGLITVFVVLAVIGLVWCAKRHFPEKIEKLLAEEASRNRPHSIHSHHTSLREQLQASAGGSGGAAAVVIPTPTTTTPGAPRSIFGRLGIRKPSILSLSSPQPSGGSTARTFSLDDLLRPPPRRTPSPRKKRNNSTPTKKNAVEKKQILQQLVSPAGNSKNKANGNEGIPMNENRSKLNVPEVEISIEETTFAESPVPVVATIVRPISDPKLEKKVTFARLLSKVSAEMSSGSEADLGNGARNSSALSLPVEVTHRANSVPPSPVCTNEMRSPHSTSSNQGSGSLSSSELALNDFGLKANRRIRSKVSSADSILAMFKNFASSNAAINLPSSIILSPSSTPTASSPQDDVAGDDESSTSSILTPVSYSSGGGAAGGGSDSPIFYRQSNTQIEVPVLDQISAHKTTPSLLHPPTILLEIPSSGNKCLSPIRELPTPMPSPAITPIMPRPQRTRTPSPIGRDETMSIMFSDDDDRHNEFKSHKITFDDAQKSDSSEQSSSKNSSSDSARSVFTARNQRMFNRVPAIQISIDIEPPSPERTTAPQRPRDLIIPQLVVQEPSPTKPMPPIPPLIICPGSPPPHRSFDDDTHFVFPSRPQQPQAGYSQQPKRLLKQQFEKPTSLDLPFAPPMITITTNMSEVESSDPECVSPGPTKSSSNSSTLGIPTSGMCYLSPFSMCGRGERAPSESNLSSSGYSSMASPGPSRCGSSNPLFLSETEDPGPGPPGPHYGLHSSLAQRRQTSILKKCSQGTDSSGNNTSDGNRERRCSDSETLSDDLLHESNDEGIGTDHIDEKIEEGEIKSAKELEVFIENEMVEKGKVALSVEEPVTMAQLQLPAIVIQTETGADKLSPVSSRSESPMSERTIGMGSFSPYFYGKKDQHLPFTDSDGLYDFPSSDGRGSGSVHHRKSIGKRRDRRSSKTGNMSPSKSPVHLELPVKEQIAHHSLTKHQQQLTPTRKSPKRRPIPRYPVVSSSSSTESITSAKEILSKGFTVTSRKQTSNESEEGFERGTSCPNIPKPSFADVTVPSRKISRLRAIGHQIRFLRRLEKSLKRRNHTISPSDSCPEDNLEPLDSPKASSPLLQSSNVTKPRTNKVWRQKRITYKQPFESKSSWPEQERTAYSIYSEFNSD